MAGTCASDADERPAARVHLEAAAPATDAAESVVLDDEVADLATQSGPAGQEVAIDDRAAANAGAEGHQQQRAGAGAVPVLAPGGRVTVVLEHRLPRQR